MSLNDLIQLTILIFAAISAYLIKEKSNSSKRLGFIIGLLLQPLWFYTCYITKQWGLAALSIYYVYIYVSGYLNHLNDTEEIKRLKTLLQIK